MGQIEQDLLAIEAFPPSLRWFVQDKDDADFLLAAASGVFDDPQEPAIHRSQFLRACLDRSPDQSTSQPDTAMPMPKMGWET